jgi:hypothetical protein
MYLEDDTETRLRMLLREAQGIHERMRAQIDQCRAVLEQVHERRRDRSPVDPWPGRRW